MKKRSLIWFVLGLGYSLQLVASLSLTELLIFVATPILVFQEMPHIRRNGLMPMFVLSCLVVFGCGVSILYNHTPMVAALRGLAVTALLPCALVVSHKMLRTDMAGFG